ncbi:protein-export membrane protein SecF [Candidatus Amesbacteria bacterium RIFCSPHIGHO2_01_FULL_48_32]|uniref:Protein-export membrane protein SecF n=1 Tax=Candidatus Amesbacteria bacterium RIFCSPLOWO2_01_FULL_48_25 TaxID=1797259 RepID=A0A1F4ZCV1_9BACT|nr:MAG: protein-export membrane protein SecF [Candidatus Amesbacteria bacterium RIFCSPHIGHO2_01_FULL_48_32]OGD03244.1 MAG: protein-export membrane protein SecF [Candidatus Amesbacteria bacterium RIFCSPLOWO2_01_FULL_48_25]HJZ05189.1 protein translocase subunit SecF [Patescibacteria group bacterium]
MAGLNNYIPFMKYKWLYFAISLLVLLPGIYSLIRYGLRLSIDFTGGTLLEIQASSSANFATTAKAQGLDLSSVQSAGADSYLLRFKPTTHEQNEKFKAELQKLTGPITEKRFETVGPTIGRELTQKAIFAVILASLFIILYISWTFRQIPKKYTSWKFGISAVIALLHDAFVVLGLFSLFGHFYHVEIDSLFVTAVLTVIGFSVHDTIVVFDRIRENLVKLPQSTFEQVVDFSLTETLARSLNTSLTVTLTLTALLLFGGESIRWFVAALLIGVVSGTFSSIFNAAPLLVLWESRK